MPSLLHADTLRFLEPFVIMATGLTVGYVYRLRRGDCVNASRRVTRMGLTWFDPLNVSLALWGQQIVEPRLAALPAIGLLMAVMAALPAWIWVRARKTPSRRAGVLVSTSLFSNLGPTFGTFMCFVLAGEPGFAAGTLLTLYFYPTFFTIGLLIGRRYGGDGGLGTFQYMIQTMRDPASRNPLLSVFVGLALSFWAPARPDWLAWVPSVVVPGTTFIYLVGIGMTLNFGRVKEFVRHALAVGAVKFLYTPLVGLGFAYLFSLFGPPDPVLRQVIFVQACMPAAIFSLILANLFDLERDLANTIWLLTNGMAIALSPLVLLIARALR